MSVAITSKTCALQSRTLTKVQLPQNQIKFVDNLDKIVNNILKSFNTWSFKREQPSDVELLKHFIAASVFQNTPISFVLYWGKGPRNHVAAPDSQCLAYLSSLKQRITAQYSIGADLTLCLTDTHARHNGHGENDVRSYYGEVISLAHKQGFKIAWLSDLVQQHGSRCVLDEPPDIALLDDLKRCASKWYRGNGGNEHGAREYFAMNMIERSAVERAFPKSIFITFNGSDYRSIFPATLPIFYMYSLKKGTCVKPWFLGDDGSAYSDASCQSSTNGWQ